MPSPIEYLPNAQEVQVAEETAFRTAEKVPASHWVHAESPPMEEVPAAQSVQSDCAVPPVVALNVP